MTLLTFSKAIKKGTQKSHTMAENTGFVTNFLAGVVDKESYKQLIADFFFIYTALEEQIDEFKDDSFIRPIAFDELRRVPALEKIVSSIGVKTGEILFLLQMLVRTTSTESKRSMLSS